MMNYRILKTVSLLIERRQKAVKNDKFNTVI